MQNTIPVTLQETDGKEDESSYRGSFWETTLYYDRHRNIKCDVKEKILRLLALGRSCDSSILFQGKPCRNVTRAISSTHNGRADPYDRHNSRSPTSTSSYRHFIHTFFIRPKLRIENPRIETLNEGSPSEFKDLYFDVHNSGRWGVENFRVKFRVKELHGDFKTLNLDSPQKVKSYDLEPCDTIPVRLCQVTKGAPNTVVNVIEGKSVIMKIGQNYELEIRFIGKNFLDRKVWRAELNLTYQNIGMILKS